MEIMATNMHLCPDKLTLGPLEDEDMLEYETQLFLDIVQKDTLVIAAKGVCLLKVIANILRVYTDPGNLVLVINSNQHEERYLTSQLHSYQSSPVYTTTYSSATSDDRCNRYLSGGVHFVTTRILVLDLLKKRVPIDKITGILILNAHRVLESGQEAFVMRLYRQNNKLGFIKAFSNDAQSFTYGFAHVERIMRNIFVRDVSIWPRFHACIIASLQSRNKPELVELHIPITPKMERIQTCLLDIINILIKEIKASNSAVELSEVTVENCLLGKFMRLLQTQLDAIWERLSDASKRLAGELRVVHQLLVYQLFQADSVSFYVCLMQYRARDYVISAIWPYYRQAEQLFVVAAERVFKNSDELQPEDCPKWQPLVDIINSEIPIDLKAKNTQTATVLILCRDKRTCYQLNQLLRFGSAHYLFLQALHNGVKFKSMTSSTIDDQKTKPTKDDDEEQDLKDIYHLSMTINESVNEYMFEPADFSEDNLTSVVIRTFREAHFDGTTAITLPEALQQLQPSYVILYHSNVTAIRQLEFYEARRKNCVVPTKIFILVHTGTVEEQSYLTLLKREKQAFEFLIQTKATMATPEDQDGRSDISCPSPPTTSSRTGGASSTKISLRSVIVDVREFRSELPALLHKRGIHIEPVTITVGDYILTRDICVERKSISDLIGSLQSGRLYAQCKAMQRAYPRPMLLIEFDQSRPFGWDSQYVISSGDFDVQRKLVLLTMHFPTLRIIWSPNPYATAALFDELKEGKSEPNVDLIQSQQDANGFASNYNAVLSDVLPRMPGVTSRIALQLMARYTDLKHLCRAAEVELRGTMTASDAQTLHTALHTHTIAQEGDGGGRARGRAAAVAGGRNKFKYNKKM